jgi:hypothetical protein
LPFLSLGKLTIERRFYAVEQNCSKIVQAAGNQRRNQDKKVGNFGGAFEIPC